MLKTLSVKFSENPFRDSEFVTYRRTGTIKFMVMFSQLFMLHLKEIHFLKISLLRCYAVSTGKYLPTFRTNY
jgi:hypothetical protein